MRWQFSTLALGAWPGTGHDEQSMGGLRVLDASLTGGMVVFVLHPSAVVGSEKLLFSFRRNFGHLELGYQNSKAAIY